MNSDVSTKDRDTIGLIQQATSSEILMLFLSERHEMYKNRSSAEIIRMRGSVLARFEDCGLPANALPCILEELENSNHAYTTAGAAIALRGAKPPIQEAIPYLFKAIKNIRYHDDAVVFRRKCQEESYTSALAELINTLDWYDNLLGGHLESLRQLQSTAYNFNKKLYDKLSEIVHKVETLSATDSNNCCSDNPYPGKHLFSQNRAATRDPIAPSTVFENHKEEKIDFKDLFLGKPTIVTFFYTRCENPNKCALTITRLAILQKMVQKNFGDRAVRIAAITYDATYDEPFRLKLYTENRGLILNENCSVLRAVEGEQELQNYFELGVNYVNKIVTRHRIELYLLDSKGEIALEFSRLQWDDNLVLLELRQLLKKERLGWFVKAIKKTAHFLYSVFISLAIVFFPKCPLCWAAYLSAAGIASADLLAYNPLLLYVFFALMCINIWAIWKRSKRRNFFLPLYLSLTGIGLIILFSFLLNLKTWSIAGVILITVSTFLSSGRLNGLRKAIKFN